MDDQCRLGMQTVNRLINCQLMIRQIKICSNRLANNVCIELLSVLWCGRHSEESAAGHPQAEPVGTEIKMVAHPTTQQRNCPNGVCCGMYSPLYVVLFSNIDTQQAPFTLTALI